MQHKFLARALSALFAGAAIFALPLAAQTSQDSSVAEAARRSRAQHQAATKPATVITNDTLKPAPADDARKPDSEQPQPAAAGSASTAPATPPVSPADAAKKKQQIEALKQQIAEKQNEVDLQRREVSLENDSYYSKPDFSNDKAGKEKLDAMQEDLKQKQDELAKLKAKFADLGGVEEPKAQAPPTKP